MYISCLSNCADQCMPIIAHFLLEWIPFTFTFTFVKKYTKNTVGEKVQQFRQGPHPPLFRPMPERKHFFRGEFFVVGLD